MADSAFFCTLSHEGVLAVRGADAGKFLQGQLTCNLNYLSDNRASLGARCTQKGRMQSSFRILLEGDGVLLAMASELLEPQLADLKKYAVFSKSKLTDESAAWVRFGVEQGDEALKSLGLELPAETDSLVRHDGLIAIRVSPEPGTQLFAPSHGSSIGEVVLAANAANQIELLAVLQAEAAEGGDIHLGALDGPALNLLDLPYELDRDREIQR